MVAVRTASRKSRRRRIVQEIGTKRNLCGADDLTFRLLELSLDRSVSKMDSAREERRAPLELEKRWKRKTSSVQAGKGEKRKRSSVRDGKTQERKTSRDKKKLFANSAVCAADKFEARQAIIQRNDRHQSRRYKPRRHLQKVSKCGRKYECRCVAMGRVGSDRVEGAVAS